MYLVSDPEIQTPSGHWSLNIYDGFGLNFSKVRSIKPEVAEMLKKE